MDEFNLSSTPLNEMQNHDDFKIVWLGLFNYIPKELTNFTDYLKKFSSFEECNDHIKKIKSERQILLVFTSFFDYLSYFIDLPQIHSIYILDKNCQNIEYDKEKYSQLINVFMDERKLIERLRQDILLKYRNDLPINISRLQDMTIEQSLTNFDKTTLMFIWNQLFTYYLVNSSQINMNKLKEDMIKQCQLEYMDDKVEEKKIKEFDENCTFDNVLEWYTRDSFVYRLVNRAFRTRNIDLICKFRYFIILLYKKLKELSIQQEKKNYTTVYRGQTLGKNDLKNLQLNVGCLISWNTIMSTSRDPDIANIFILAAEVGIIFEINIANTSCNTLQPYADISQFSINQVEEEILIFAGAVFRIDSVEAQDASKWVVKLTLTNETVEQIDQFMVGIQNQLNYKSYWEEISLKTDDFNLMAKYYKILTNKSFIWKDILTNKTGIDLCYLINNLGNYKKTIEYYEKLLLDKSFTDQSKFIVLNIIIGNNYFRLKQFDDVLICYNIALSLLDDKNRLTGELYSHLGDVCRETNNMEDALSYYKQALEILINCSVNDRYIARIYKKVSDIHQKQNNFESAKIYEEQANEIDKNFRQQSEFNIEKSLKDYKNRLNNKPGVSLRERANILYSMSVCLINKREYYEAIKMFLETKQLFEKDLPSYDDFIRNFVKVYDGIALAYLLSKDNFNALVMWKRAIDIRTSFLRK